MSLPGIWRVVNLAACRLVEPVFDVIGTLLCRVRLELKELKIKIYFKFSRFRRIFQILKVPWKFQCLV